jgi:uncharacterized protein
MGIVWLSPRTPIKKLACAKGAEQVYACTVYFWGSKAMHRWMVMLTLLTGCHSLENGLVFHPMPSDGKSARPPIQDVELRCADGVQVHARWHPHPKETGVLLYCHGNAGNLEQRGELMNHFGESLKRSVLIFDYPGFGRSTGTPTESGCYASAEAAYEWLRSVKGIAPERIVICGESLGGGVAVDLASKRPQQALVLIRTFTSVPDVGKTFVSSAPAIMVNRFDSLKKIGTCPAPIFLAQADRDRVISFEQGERLREACKAPVRFYRLQGLDHNDPLPAEFFRELRGFLEDVETQAARR